MKVLVMHYTIRSTYRVTIPEHATQGFDGGAYSRGIEECVRSLAGQANVVPESIEFEVIDSE